MLQVLKQVNNFVTSNSKTFHANEERKERFAIADGLKNNEHVILSCLCDTGHKNGLEVHQLTDAGLIYIYNQTSKKLVTVLIARPGQVRRYYEQLNLLAPHHVVELARQHQLANLNN